MKLTWVLELLLLTLAGGKMVEYVMNLSSVQRLKMKFK
jgi:hypothetical protein